MSESTISVPTSIDSEASTNETNREMWHQIARMPFDLLSKTNDFIYIEKVMRLISKYQFEVHDEHMADPQYTLKLGKLLLTVSTQSLMQVDHLRAEIERINNEKLIEKRLSFELENKSTELAFRRRSAEDKNLRNAESYPISKENASKVDESKLDNELVSLKDENAALSLELNKAKSANEELRQLLQTQREENTSIHQDDAKMHLEYRHLVSRYRRLMEKFDKTQKALEEYRANEPQGGQPKGNEHIRLQEEIKALRQENYILIESRDRAEELCEQRESEALRDMTKLRRLTKDLLDEERSKLREATERYVALKKERDTTMEHLINRHAEDLRVKNEEIALLRQQLEKMPTRGAKRFEDSSVMTASANEDSNNFVDSFSEKSERRRLERENADLAAEVEELELRIDAMEEENKRLSGFIKDYESGNEGLLHLRYELTDRMRTVEMLQDENAQLRERLNYLEDSLTFTAALEALCKRVGVTDAEINSLRSKSAMGYDEVSTLREEMRVLKEEIEWLEKDRRHWMNKVRLQPLMDTKLRFELGLTAEQLKRLDVLVDQMKSTKSINEDADPSYKEQYPMNLETQRGANQEFSEYVKAQIESAIKGAFTELRDGNKLEHALSSLKTTIEALKPVSTDDPGEPSSIFALKAELTSTKREVEEFELMIKDNESVIQTLREKLAAAADEKEALIKERDQYKSCMFATLGLTSDATNGTFSKNSFDGSRCDNASVEGDGAVKGDRTKWAAIASSLRDQLRAKDDVIEALNHKLAEVGNSLKESQRQIEAEKQISQSNLRVQETLNDQISALQEINEEMHEKNVELKKINAEVTSAMHQMENGESRELIQKVVLLRRREAKLLSRLRKAITTQEDAEIAKARMQTAINTTFKNLQEALEGSTTGFVLPSSSAFHDHEKKQLDLLQTSLKTLLQGRLFREDSRYLLHLQQVYNNMEMSEENYMLREKDRASTRTIDALQDELDQLKLQVEVQRTADPTAQCRRSTDVENVNNEYSAAAASRWESESIMWRQKYELCYKRLEAKTEEVSLLEKDLDTVRQEMIEVKDNVRNLLQKDDPALPSSPMPLRNGQEGKVDLEKEKVAGAEMAPSSAQHIHESKTTEPLMIEKLARLERDMARLKSVNLGLLQHSLDLQSTLKSSEIELQASKQEIALIKDANNTKAVSDFVNAAIREHTALRRQSELALIQVKQLKIQLTATEANYQVVANEATSYKLSAYRLYRRYIEEMVAVVDYIRCLQRACKGSLSPHRSEIMDKRFRLMLKELNSVSERNKSLATNLSDKLNDIKTLEQQISFLRIEKEPGRSDAIEHEFLDARATIRRTMHQFTECEEDLKFSEAKAQREEAYAQELSEEITRLEFRCWNMTAFEEASYEKLLHLRDTVFAKAETPPLAIQPIEAVSLHSRIAETGKAYSGADDDDIAIREYKTAILKQKELARECAGLREEREAKSREIQKLSSNIEELQDRIKHLDNKATLYQGHLEAERVRAEEREARLRKAHEVQSEVALKATERNCHCLRDIMQRKDKEIHQLQQQLHAERQKHAEQQLEEASRLERFHERMFSENEVMIERFKNAIQDRTEVGNENQLVEPAFLGTDNSIFEQLRGLTSDNIRLRRELQAAHTANVVLESQLNQQNQDLRDVAQKIFSAGSKGATWSPHVDATGDEGLPQSHSSVQQLASPSPDASTAREPTPSMIKGNDILTGIINNQGAMIESLRQREAALSSELQKEKELHSKASVALHELQAHQVEQEGTLRLATQVSSVASDSTLVRELRSNIVYLEQELRNTKEALDQEKILSNRLQMDVEDWRKHLESLQLEVSHQRVEVERSVQIAALNQALQGDLEALKEQNEKLMAAVSLIKERLMEEARRGSETKRQHHQELALARRMGVIQNESMEHIKVLDHRMKSIQQELNERVDKEKEALARNENTQRMVYQLHQNLRHKEAELVSLKQKLYHMRSEKNRSAVECPSLSEIRPQSFLKDKGIQVIATDVNQGAGTLAPYPSAPPNVQPPAVSTTETLSVTDDPSSRTKSAVEGAAHQENIVSSIARRARKMESDNLQSISELRSQLARTEKDLADAREHITAARESNQQLRQQLRSHKNNMEEMVKRHTCELAELRSLLASNKYAPKTRKVAHSGTDLQQHIATPKLILPAQHKTLLVESQANQQEQDAIVEELRRQLQVDVPARENTLHRRIVELNATIDCLVDRLARAENCSTDEVRRAYSVPFTEQGKSIAVLQDEILEKNNAILNLRFTQESLNLQIGRLKRRLVDSIDAEDTGESASKSKKLLQQQLLWAQKAHDNQMEAMVATIDNLKILIEHLRTKNSEFTLQASHMAKYDEALSEMRHLRTRLGAIQENFLDLLRTSSALAQPTISSHSDRQPKLRQRLATAQTESDEHDVHPKTFQTQLEGQAFHIPTRGDETKTASERQCPFLVPESKGLLLPRLSVEIESTRRESVAPMISESVFGGRDDGVPPPLSPAPLVDTFESSASSRHVDALVASHGDMRHHHKLKKKTTAMKGDQTL